MARDQGERVDQELQKIMRQLAPQWQEVVRLGGEPTDHLGQVGVVKKSDGKILAKVISRNMQKQCWFNEKVKDENSKNKGKSGYPKQEKNSPYEITETQQQFEARVRLHIHNLTREITEAHTKGEPVGFVTLQEANVFRDEKFQKEFEQELLGRVIN
jgi:organic radical activating enzyme